MHAHKLCETLLAAAWLSKNLSPLLRSSTLVRCSNTTITATNNKTKVHNEWRINVSHVMLSLE